MTKNLKKFSYGGITIYAPARRHAERLFKASKILQKYDEELYTRLLTLRAIIITSDKGYDNELFVQKRIWISQRFVSEKLTLKYLASLLAHEAHHLIQHDKGVKNVDSRAEKKAYAVQKKMLIDLGQKYIADWLETYYQQNVKGQPKKGEVEASHSYFEKVLKIIRRGVDM